MPDPTPPRSHDLFGRSRTILGVGIVLTLLAAVGVTAWSVDALRRSQQEVNRLARISEQRGFTIRHIERIEQLVAELETAVLRWTLEPGEPTHAAAVEQLSDSFDDEARRLGDLMPGIGHQPWSEIRHALRRSQSVLGRMMAARDGPDTPAAEAVTQPLERPLAELGAALEAAERNLRFERDSILAHIQDRLRWVWRGILLAGAIFVLVVGGLWLGILRLIARKNAEIAATLSKLHRANDELDAFAGRTAHELRNVLAPARLAAQCLAEAPSSEARATALHQLDRSFHRASEVIESLLDFARAGQPSRGPACVAQVAREVVEAEGSSAATLDVQLTCDVEPAQVRCTEGLLHAVVTNLVGNAIKFTAGSSDARVEVRSETRGGELALVIEDNGPGIPDDDVRRVCEPFFRSPSSQRGGSGIGLATVAKIVAAHDGRVDIETGRRRGTCVRVFLPLHAPTS